LEQLDNYQSDELRYEDFETGKKIHEYIIKAYKMFGYKLIFIPKASVEERLNIILGHVKKRFKNKQKLSLNFFNKSKMSNI